MTIGREQKHMRLSTSPETNYLAYRDLPAIFDKHVTGRDVLDFGCGAGRSTRFLKKLGFNVTGIDISSSMIEMARKADPRGNYQLVGDGDFSAFARTKFDLVLSAFAFDNIPSVAKRTDLLGGLRRLLKNEGRIILLGSNLISTPMSGRRLPPGISQKTAMLKAGNRSES